jgi:hypothetical protein
MLTKRAAKDDLAARFDSFDVDGVTGVTEWA